MRSPCSVTGGCSPGCRHISLCRSVRVAADLACWRQPIGFSSWVSANGRAMHRTARLRIVLAGGELMRGIWLWLHFSCRYMEWRRDHWYCWCSGRSSHFLEPATMLDLERLHRSCFRLKSALLQWVLLITSAARRRLSLRWLSAHSLQNTVWESPSCRWLV